ncbi:MAG: cell division ATP-binding protein FtsE [Candidatus Blackburnbacteria bacterium RIFCSPHIGHO2_02_FULL_39_13]|uniref:Cell division ATP-binding protein FtsE n=1 Tax=Candidatus Blackburnbacteria bacterium RIFCSPLOWO2_01_FULL_40_20 TaxID=1797519 RepID=A0A1G1VFI7_9BACT|nr:MAG: Cell division ATP-binding protein FtsE [Microgenomates group bacterium GW2011_GWA2_39_19]OGY06792.1 MAG: cell division ATP-binding protein FtsE [Candidatus Blackburnbacteria bacterium RIFCSPHIGHO2_01_FULL_40_17]OGY09807.1 MAG: cell division ATP-binding protein FtsE [Candidatus Blackburnbacteria bacterium RIFCSPHIGHO2_02_FULL_39_13]OGY14087.1 MAG: cell division ATP-binding protein FtsE [Candidatus Blackburnbacteria bacterium RIFCSPLOWO2_01_FULL_40_20]HBL52292.1 cell division ATP-binding 
MITFEKVVKKFGSTSALDEISFDIKEGEFVFLTGSSGAGKTTLVRLLLRELTPDSGKILIEDRDISTLKSCDIPHYRRKLGVVFQDFKLLLDRTVYENVALALEVTGEWENKSSSINDALEEVGLSQKANLFPRQLAGGEQQRAVIARALVTNPKLVLADEPTGNLDPATARQIVELLDKISKSGTTVLMATHNEILVNSLKRRVIKLKDGKVASDKVGAKYDE